jgi:hypothetical protein
MAASSIALWASSTYRRRPFHYGRQKFAEWLYASKSTDAEWWERSNATNHKI